MTGNGNGAEFNRLDIIQEIEQLKQQLTRFETEVQPLADRELQRIKDEAVKSYQLNEAQAQVMADRLAELSNEQAINDTALQLAGQFRATGKRDYVDPQLQGNGQRQQPSYAPLHEAGQQAYKSAMEWRHGKKVSSIHIPAQPKPFNRVDLQRKGVLGRLVDKFR